MTQAIYDADVDTLFPAPFAGELVDPIPIATIARVAHGPVAPSAAADVDQDMPEAGPSRHHRESFFRITRLSLLTSTSCLNQSNFRPRLLLRSRRHFNLRLGACWSSLVLIRSRVRYDRFHRLLWYLPLPSNRNAR